MWADRSVSWPSVRWHMWTSPWLVGTFVADLVQRQVKLDHDRPLALGHCDPYGRRLALATAAFRWAWHVTSSALIAVRSKAIFQTSAAHYISCCVLQVSVKDGIILAREGPKRLGRVTGLPLGLVGGPILRLAHRGGLRLALIFLGQPAGRANFPQVYGDRAFPRRPAKTRLHGPLVAVAGPGDLLFALPSPARERWSIGTC